MKQRLLKSADFTNRPTNLYSHFYTPVNWLQISGENCHFDPPLQNSGLRRKYTSVTFNILAFITIYVCLSTETILTKSKI